MEKRNETTGSGIIRVAITGPESTGKSALAKELAKHYSTVYVPEYARKYLEFLGRPYLYYDLKIIAQRQLLNENQKQRKANGYLFCDTELSVIKIWSEHRYKKCDPWIMKWLNKITYDIYLLCDIDLPWEADPQREHPHLRQYLLDKYKEELSGRNLPFVIISGNGEKRIQMAIEAVESIRIRD